MEEKEFTFKSTSDKKNTIGYMMKVMDAVKENPDNPGYPPEEVERIKKMNDELEASLAKMTKNSSLMKFAKLWNDLIDSMKELPTLNHNIFKQTQHIAALGWYISPELFNNHSLEDMNRLLQKENAEELEKQIIADAEEMIPLILKKCTGLFPDRKLIFDEILLAFSKELYSQVVMACYTQADAMYRQIATDKKKGFFDRESRKDALPRKLLAYNQLKEIDKGILSGIVEQLKLTDNEMTMYTEQEPFLSNPELKTNSFNRHLVIHGHSINYGTRINAIRTIYLLDFLFFIVREVQRRENIDEEE